MATEEQWGKLVDIASEFVDNTIGYMLDLKYKKTGMPPEVESLYNEITSNLGELKGYANNVTLTEEQFKKLVDTAFEIVDKVNDGIIHSIYKYTGMLPEVEHLYKEITSRLSKLKGHIKDS